jgi:hypothetical protein
MTGRGLGFCAGFNQPGAFTPGFGRGMGFGRGRGFGRGFGRGRNPGFERFWGMTPLAYPYGYGAPGAAPTVSPDQEKNMLQQEAQAMRDALSNLEKRIAELENKESTS